MNTFHPEKTNGIVLTAQPLARQHEVLTSDALVFIARLHRATAERRQDLLRVRHERRSSIQQGRDPRFPAETAHIRIDPSWRVAPPSPGLEDRRVEITGPVATCGQKLASSTTI